MRHIFRILAGKDVREVFPGNERYQGLEGRIASLEKLLDTVVSDPQMQWLYRNRSERMDATLDIFPEERREFHLARYRFALPYVAGKVVADIASGTGYGTELLHRNGNAQQVIGVDIDDEAVRYAADRHTASAIRYVCASGDETGLPSESVDVVVSFETIEHVPSDRRLLDEFHRLLKPGGTLIVSTPNNWALEDATHHVRVYNRETLETVLQDGFKQFQFFNQNSGVEWKYNHGQKFGICPTTPDNQDLAECYLVVCQKR